LSEHLLEGHNILNILDDACSIRTAQAIWKDIAESPVRQCEKKLRVLQKDLVDVDRELLDMENRVGQLQDLAQQIVGTSRRDLTSIFSHTHIAFYDSNSSVESGVSSVSLDNASH